jgi:subtilisin family serine protease
MRFGSFLSVFTIVAIFACVKKKQASDPNQIVPETNVAVPQGAVEDLGLSEEHLKRVYSNENLSQAQAQLVSGKNFELNVLLREDWRERVPLRLKGGVIKKHDDLETGDQVVGVGELFVNAFKTSASAADSLRRASSNGEQTSSRPFDLMKIEIKDNSLVGLITAMNLIHKLPGVIFAEPNFRVRKIATVNDPSFPSLWGMTKIKAPETWDSYTGSQDAVVAVIDTGVDFNHEDLKDNIWVNTKEIPKNGVDDDGNGYIDDVNGWDFAYGDNNPMDGDSHGTHCAGTIAARGNNALGVVGVNWKARVMPVKVLDDSGGGYNYDIYNGIIYAVTNGAKVTSNSYGGGGASSLMASAIKTAQDKGSLFVAASGNESASKASYPAYYTKTYNNVISVASTETNDSLSSFSNYGDGVDVAAPGRNILSTTPGNSYATYSGTSMATPHVAGIAALLWSAAPSKTLGQIRAAILGKADSIAALSGKVATSGRVNLKASYDSLDGVVSPSPSPTPTATPTASPTPDGGATPEPSPSPTAMPTASPTPVPTPEPTPVPTLPPTPVYSDGLNYRYYHGFWLRVPDFDSMRPVASGTISELSLSVAKRKSQFGIVFEGLVWVPTSGTYTFYLKSDDGSLLSIDGNRVVVNDGLHGPRERTGTVELAPGFHSIRIDYFQLLGGTSLNLQWSGPGITRRKMGGRGVFYSQ